MTPSTAQLREILSVIYHHLSAPILFRMLIGLIGLSILSVAYNPVLNFILKAPLLSCIGMQYGDIQISVWKLKLKITDIVLTPSKSSNLKYIFLILFPSGNVLPSKNSVDFPESKITVGKITIKARISSLARSTNNNDYEEDEGADSPFIRSCRSDKHSNGSEKETTTQKEMRFTGLFSFMNHFLPRPVIEIALHNVTIHVEKVYLAPKPPPIIMQHLKKSTTKSATKNDSRILPVAIPHPLNNNDEEDVLELPTFDQEYFWEMIANEGFLNAETLTFYLERWIDHAVIKLKSKGGEEANAASMHSKSGISSSPSSPQRKMKSEPKSELPAKNTGAKKVVPTYDEKINAWISFLVKGLCHTITLDLMHASIVISGAGSEYVKKIRKDYPPREANLKLAQVPKQQRAVSVHGADLISLSFSPDSQCNLILCFVGVYLKVGYPLLGSMPRSSTKTTNSQYIWHPIVNPLYCVAEIKGVISFLIYALSYDHYWETRCLELDVSVSENILNLSPTHIHTLFLHWDSYTDISCPLFQWLYWLRSMRSEALNLTMEQKVAYCNNYARIKAGLKVDERESNGQHLLTSSQMKEMELAMNQWEIMSLRCFAMKNHWLIPKENAEISEYLRNTRSSISFGSDAKIEPLADYFLSPFQQVYPTPLHALAMLVWEKTSILATHVAYTFSVGSYIFDFPSDLGDIKSGGDSERKAIPSSLVCSGVEFTFEKRNPVFHRSESSNIDAMRSCFDLSLQVTGLRWELAIGEDDEILNELPRCRSLHPVGLVYDRHGSQRLESVFSIRLEYSISPTSDRKQHFDLSFEASDLVAVINPLPLLSSIDTLNHFLQFPNAVNETPDESETVESLLGINSDVIIRVRNISFLFLIDRRKINRGLLEFNINKIDIESKTEGCSGKLKLLTGPFALCAARVAHNQSHLINGIGLSSFIDYWLMPFKPIILIEGVEIFATAKVETQKKRKTAIETFILGMNLKINTDSFTLNLSPTTIVAIRSVATSLEPVLFWMQRDTKEKEQTEQMKLEETKRKNVEIQRQALMRIFKEIDIDGNKCLTLDEFDQAFAILMDEARRGCTLTDEDRARETKHLFSIVDRSKSNEVTFQELDEAFQLLVNDIDDTNLAPKRVTGNSLFADFSNSDQFLSSYKLRQLIYFEDLREYASMHIVKEITGGMGKGKGSNNSFPSPSLWQQGSGIDVFWELYTKTTGCSRTSLNGQNMEYVQRMLVRSLCNFEFAKFCWKSIVQPEMSANDHSNMTNTRWLLDNNNYQTLLRSGVMDQLMRHVFHMTKVSMEEKEDKAAPMCSCKYDLSVSAVVNSASIKFGSSHEFAKPLLEINVTHMTLNASTFLSGDGRFIEIRELKDDHAESRGRNVIQVQGVMSAMYLNTKHSHMECFIEPYPCFGQATYQALFPDSLHPKAVSHKTWSVKVDCPRFFNINTSPSFFDTGYVITSIISRADPVIHREFLRQRDLTFIRNIWDVNPNLYHGCLDRNSALDVLCDATDAHWKQEFQGLSSASKREMLGKFIDRMGGGNDFFSFDAVETWFKTLTSRCYFTGSEEIQLYNDSGMELKVTAKCNFDKQRFRFAVINEANFQLIVNSFQGICNRSVCAVSLKDNGACLKSHENALCGNLSIYVSGFRLLENVPVDPYQKLLFKLRMRKGLYGRSTRRRSSKGVSGFQPYLTVAPKATSLDTITLYVRSNVVIRSEIPVKIRIVRLGKSAGQFSKQGLRKRNKRSIDLTKKYLMTALSRAVEGALIVYESRCNGEGDVVSLPVSLLMSSSFHAILIQDLSGKAKNAWRSPLLFTRDFLFNPMNICDVSRYHTMSGVVVLKERLNVQNTGKSRYKTSTGDTKKSIMRRTAWDITILVVPFFLCMNTLPFPISVRAWQHANKDEEDEWDDGAAAALLIDPEDTNEISSTDDESAMTPSVNNKGINEHQYHLSTKDNSGYYHEDTINVGQTLRLSGISLSRPLFIQVSQHLYTSRTANLIRSNPLRLDLQKLKTGMNRKGTRSLPKLVLDLGDNCDCLVDVSLDRANKMPLCTIYSPYWLVNKTGMKLEYCVAGWNDDAKHGGKRYLDSGAGGLPILLHCSKSGETNAKMVQGSRQLSVIPLESPRREVLRSWWDEDTNGKLVLKKNAIVKSKYQVTDWSQKINLDAAGTNGEIHCDCFVLEANIETLAGTFYRSNLIKLTPRFIVKNGLHISISIMPFAGGPRDARKTATHLRECLSEIEEKSLINLSPGESTIVYNFQSFRQVTDRSYRWVALRVNARRFGASFKCKWHMIPLDVMKSNLFGEYDGVNDTLCGIIEAKVHWSKAGSVLTSITHVDTPPFRIENRSQTHYLQLAQDDDEANIIELPPMHSCGYTWDSPLGKKRLRVAVIPGRQSAQCLVERGGKTSDYDAKSTTSTIESDDESDSEAQGDLLSSLMRGISTDLSKGKKSSTPQTSQQWVHSRLARKYNLQLIGNQKDLPIPNSETCWMGTPKHNESGEHLTVHTRISTGTKVISFNDSDWLTNQIEAGLLLRGGDFKSALIDINIEGAGIYFNDNYPRELMGVVARDIQVCKPMGTIELTARLRHFQIDAMLPNARYPIIIQPLPMGVDRRKPEIDDSSSMSITPQSIQIRDCYWKRKDEKPIPLYEMKCSYVPQNKIMWIPNLEVSLCPMKLQLDVDYILRVLSLIFDSTSKYRKGEILERNQGLIYVNENLKYTTRGSMNFCLTYVENFYIHPVEVQLEINVKSDEEDFDEEVDSGGETSSSLNLHTISQSTNSEWVAGIMGWLINVGANFAHVSPTYTYSSVYYTDNYADIIDLAEDVFNYYLMHTIKQCYKVVFSMHLLGDPSLLLHQWKTGVTDIVIKTGDEIRAGGQDGFGKGVGSLLQNVFGGTFFALGRVTGSVADTVTAITTTSLTSDKLKPKSASSNGRNDPEQIVDGIVQGTEYLARTVAHGIAGLIGNPYRGAKTGTVTGLAKGVSTGIIGVMTCPFIGALGFIAKTSAGIGQTTFLLNLGCIEARCRPRRVVPWGVPMSMNWLPYLKGIGIRIHTVRYQKVRKRIMTDDLELSIKDSSDDDITSKERRRIHAAEKRRLNPPLKVMSIKRKKDKFHHLTYPVRPKLLSDHPGNLILSHYAVTYEETIELRSSDLQLDDIVSINFWNYKVLKTTTKAKSLAVCNISVGDMYCHALTFYLEELKRKESNLAKGVSSARDHQTYRNDQSSNHVGISLILPAPQEFPLFRPLPKAASDRKDIFEAIQEEMGAIGKTEEDRIAMFASDSDAESVSSFLSNEKKTLEETGDLVKRNERLFGNVSLSFFPIPW